MSKKDKENAERIAKTIGQFTGKIENPKPMSSEDISLLNEIALNFKKVLKNHNHDLSAINKKLISRW